MAKKATTKRPAAKPAAKKAARKSKRGKRPVQAPAPIGRPTDYSAELAEAICELVYQDYTLRQICELPNMPGKSTLLRWLAKHDEFRDQYACAHEVRAFSLEDEISEIADDSRNDWMQREAKNGSIELVINEEAIARSRLRIETKKWLAIVKAPKRFGKQIAVTGAGGGPMQHEHAGTESVMALIDGAGTGLPPPTKTDGKK